MLVFKIGSPNFIAILFNFGVFCALIDSGNSALPFSPQNAQQEQIIRVKRGGSWGHRFASLGAIGAGVAANYVAYDFLKNKRHKNKGKTPQRPEEKDSRAISNKIFGKADEHLTKMGFGRPNIMKLWENETGEHGGSSPEFWRFAESAERIKHARRNDFTRQFLTKAERDSPFVRK